MDAEKNFLHRWLLPFNGLQDKTRYSERTVGNITEFMPLDKNLNRDILNSLYFHCILRRFFLKCERNDEEEKN